MTLPLERYRAVLSAREFLRALMDPKETPRVPREIRQRAKSVLKHFPSEYEMETVSKKAKDLFGDPK